MLLIALFIGLPLLEFTLLIEVGTRIGALPTLAVIVVTGVLGASLARSQGLAIWSRLQTEMAAGRPPTETMLEGFLVLLAGLVLLTPGFLTDIAGLLCLMPLTRRPLLAWLRRSLKKGVASGRVKVHMSATMGGKPPGGAGGPGGLGGAAHRPVQGPGGGGAIKDAEVLDDGSQPTSE